METNGAFSVYAFWGGIFSSVLLLVINDFYKSWKRIREKRNEQLEVHREYIRKMLLSVKSLIIRLEHIQKKDKIEVDMSRMRNLLEWYTKDGYYISSTVYLMAHVSCITNNYKKIPLSIDRNVSKISEELQSKLDKYNTIISTDSCLWYHYHVALGNSLNDNNNNIMTFYDFVRKICQDELYFQFVNQAYHFVKSLTDDKHKQFLKGWLQNLHEIEEYIIKSSLTPISSDIVSK